MSEYERINKYIAACGICSRREADRLIEEGKVLVNGLIPAPGLKVNGSEIIEVCGKRVEQKQDIHVLAYYKPVGVTCTSRDEHARRTIDTEVHLPYRVTYAGRLDRESEGLLILTNDGPLIDSMMRGKNGHEKEYYVKVNKSFPRDFKKRMEQGIYLKELDTTTRPCRIELLSDKEFRIVITEGLNRQIRRMCKSLGLEVVVLKRLRIVNVYLNDMMPGELRELSPAEVKSLREALD